MLRRLRLDFGSFHLADSLDLRQLLGGGECHGLNCVVSTLCKFFDVASVDAIALQRADWNEADRFLLQGEKSSKPG